MKILIADDDPTSRLLLNTIAARQGHECVQTADGSSAWSLLLQENIEVLLTDWMMPGLDGPELCRRVREEVKDRYVYIVLITGLGDRRQILQGMSAGADDYLVKPVDPFSLQTRLVAAERVTGLHRQVAHFRAELERANLELLGQSLTDPLTGLGNRRRMEQDLARTHAWAQRNARSYGVCLFDIDHFKLYNDHYGHLAGDEALRTVANCLRANCRTADHAYRYGGEEFLLVMPDCDLDQALTLARRASQAVCDLRIPHAERPTDPPFVTLSAGVASWSVETLQTASDLIAGADRALYEAKSSGRNRVGVERRVPEPGRFVALRQAGTA
ncbi:MAG TPA: diguanylate cyclase [Acidimicrobiales bacterium]|nr:diguanylate cyclase [Acidimicrobiales bacterium]